MLGFATKKHGIILRIKPKLQAGKEKSQNPQNLTFLMLGYRLAGTIGKPDFQLKKEPPQLLNSTVGVFLFNKYRNKCLLLFRGKFPEYLQHCFFRIA